MEPHEVAAHARQRLGMEVQAASLARARGARRGVRVWAVMTEHGHFWLAEAEGAVEVFRAIRGRGAGADATSCASPAEAARRFIELHPEAEAAAQAEAPDPTTTFTCRNCGALVVLRRPTQRTARELCKRCRHAERERERYHSDPEYRARRLAYSAARYRRGADEEPGRVDAAS
jgi:hypothetical protein